MTAPRLRLLEGADAYFPALIADIDRAEHFVWLESYILNPDAQTETVIKALEAAVGRGIEVRLLLDGFGGGFGLAAWGDRLRSAGIEVRQFRPGVRALSPRTWRRLHRKMVLIDGRIAYVGGINLLGDWVDPNHGPLTAPRLDFAVRVRNPLVTRPMGRVMAQTWWRVAWHGLLQARPSPRAFGPDMRRAWQALRPTLSRVLRQRSPARGETPSRRVRLVLRDNFRNRRSIEQAIGSAIEAAERDIIVAMAYFIPSRAFQDRLVAAVARGVRVRLLLQGRTEYWWSHWAERALVRRLVREGVEVYEYTLSFLHAKVILADDWATVGSSNVDPFSFLLSLEANLAIRDSVFTCHLRERLERAMASESARPLMASARRSGLRGWAGRLVQGLTERILLGLALLLLRLFLAYSRRAAAARG